MSHQGTNWAIQQRGLKPTTKIVLWHLCDRYNPDYGCFPAQDRLACDCEISRAGLNTHLNKLEQRGLLRRVRRVDPITRRQMSTRYILGFEEGFTPVPSDETGPQGAAAGPSGTTIPCPETGHGGVSGNANENNAFTDISPETPCLNSGHGAVSRIATDPCPENGVSRVQILDTNLVKEPLREPVKEEEDAQAREGLSDEFFGELLRALGIDPVGALPGWWQGSSARSHVLRWRDDLGLSEAEILEVAEETRHAHPTPPDGPRALDRAMERAAQRRRRPSESPAMSRKGKDAQRGATGLRASLSEQLEFYTDLVNSDCFLPPNMIGNVMRDAMLAKGLVTPQQLRMRGVL
ncbi:helix-turn-helix domain-containing protein [Rhodobacteraceae bacterium M382]|nr:helix-turn-helix domain-containing protein [Rhodobacteraceae bacterium M382]